MSKEKIKGKCIICENLVVQEAPRYPAFPAPEFPIPLIPPKCKCKSTNEMIGIDDLERERECEHFMEIEDITVIGRRRFRLRI